MVVTVIPIERKQLMAYLLKAYKGNESGNLYGWRKQSRKIEDKETSLHHHHQRGELLE